MAALLTASAASLAGVAYAQSPPPSAAAAPTAAPQGDDLERLEAARQRLADAAREVAELTARTTRGLEPEAMLALGMRSRRALIGVQLDPASGRDGVRVQQVSPGGPAAEAGVEAGDLIVAIGDLRLAGVDDSVRRMLERMQRVEAGEKLPLKLRRGDRTLDVEVVARAAPTILGRRFTMPGGSPPGVGLPAVPAAPGAPGVPAAPAVPPTPDAFMFRFPEGLERFEGWFGGIPGLELATLTPKLGEYFGTPRGVLVLRAPRDAANWKLEEGDVILAIDGREPSNGAHATRILRSYQPGEKLSLAVMRRRKRLTLAVTLPTRAAESRAWRGSPADKIGRCNDPTSSSSCPPS